MIQFIFGGSNKLSMTSTALQFTALGGVASLIWQPDPQMWVMIGVLATLAGNIVLKRMEMTRADKVREWEKEDRDEHRAEIRRAIDENTALTQEAKTLNIAAIDAGNHVTEKLKAIASSAAQGNLGRRFTDKL